MANNDRDFPPGEPVTGDETEVDLAEVERLLREEDERAGKNKDKKVEVADDVHVEEEGDDKVGKVDAAGGDEEQEGHETARTEEERELIRERRPDYLGPTRL